MSVCVCMHASARARRRVHVALLIQHATSMRHVVTSLIAPLAPPYFSTLGHKRQDYRKESYGTQNVF
jgi:hypothetical protein